MNYKLFPLFFVVLLMSFTNLPDKSNATKINTSTEVAAVSKNVSVYNQLELNSSVRYQGLKQNNIFF